MPLGKKLISLLLVLLLVAAAMPGVSATAALDRERSGSVTVHLSYQGKPVKGGTLTLYRVADLDAEGGYVLTREFMGSGVALTGPIDNAMSQKLMDYAIQQNIPGETKTVGNSGTVTFGPLEVGLYLVVQKKSADGFQKIKPFPVSIPTLVDEQIIYDVDASPKTELTPKPTDPTEPTKPTNPNLPQTGQINWPVPVMTALGIGFVALGLFLCFARKKGKYER